MGKISLYFTYQDYSSAVMHVDQALHFMPYSVDLHQWKGNILIMLNKFEEACREYDLAIQMRDKAIGGKLGMEEVFLHNERGKREEGDIQRLPFQKGTALFFLERFGEALPLIKKETITSPNNQEAFKLLGAIYLQQEKYPESLRAFERALELDSSCQESLEGKSKCLFFLGKYDETMVAVDGALQVGVAPD
jgi:tetratricopeptide (TPR) repeat protein